VSLVCETPRLILRELTAADAEAVHAWRGDPEVMRFSVTGVETLEQLGARFLPRCATRYARDCIGECGIGALELDGAHEHEIGYRLRRDCWGQGFAAEATQACVAYGRSKGLERLIAIVQPENVASIRVAEKMGMTVRKRAVFHGLDVLIYGFEAGL
jgi:ribosomal-protein-alanine N-acetyltransferase